jgi:3-hydroxyisobutyrate dehydrogenase-like beta-hydroxyacid dehydrogenase
MTRIAFLGLGRMGTPMASRLLDANHELIVWNRSHEKSQPFRDRANATIAASPAEAARGADISITMLTDEHALRDVLLGDSGIIHADPPPKLHIEMSTVGPDAVLEFAAAVAPRIEMIDAPVAGSVPQAEAGELKIFVGAAQPGFERARPLLEILGKPQHVGNVGAGAALKLVVNAQLAAVMVAVGEALALARALGIDAQIATETLADTYVGGAIRAKRPLIDGQQIPTNFALALAAKDLRLVTEAARNAGITLRSAEANRAAFEAAANAGLADADYGAIIPFIRDR